MFRFLAVIVFASLTSTSLSLQPGNAAQVTTDPKIACQAEDLIISIAGVPPDKLDFFGRAEADGSFRCEAFFSFFVYREVWDRVNNLIPTLNEIEAACAVTKLMKLPNAETLSVQYEVSSAGKFEIKRVSEGLPSERKSLAKMLRAILSQLEQIRGLDEDALYRAFARTNCTGANYQDEVQ